MGPTESSSVQGAVPAASTGSQLEGILSSLNIDQRTMREAITPVAGAHAGQIPSALTKQIGPAPQGQGYANPRSKGQAISNMITSAGNAVSEVLTAEKKQKQEHLTDATTKLMQSSQLKDEAVQQKESATNMLADADPGSPEAESYKAIIKKSDETIKQNDDAMNKITIDPKLRKDLAKILHVNHVDLSANDPVHLQILHNATKNVKSWQEKREATQKAKEESNRYEAARFSQEFQKSMPQAAGAPNVLAQQKLQTQLAQQKIQQLAIKDFLTFKASIAHANATVSAAQIRTIGAGMMEQQRLAFQHDQTLERFAQAEKMQGIRFRDDLRLVVARGAEARKVANEIYTDKEADPLTMYTKARTASSLYEKNALEIGKTLAELEQAKSTLYAGFKTPVASEVDPLNFQIQLYRDAQKDALADAKHFKDTSTQLHNAFGLDDTGTSNAGSTGTGSSSQSDAVGGEPDYTDPLNY